MERIRVRFSVLTMAFAVMVALGLFCVAVARADEDYVFTLTVNPADGVSSAVSADLDRAEVTLDVYKLADAIYEADEGGSGYDTYRYENWAEGFDTIATHFATVSQNRESMAEDWQGLYAEAAQAVAESGMEPYTSGPFGEFTLNDRGLYLVMAHGYVPADGAHYDAQKGFAGVAYGDYLRFLFPPTMVAAPTKWADAEGSMSGVIYTDWEYGEWHDDAAIYLKSSYEPLYGSLRIDKAVEGYTGEETTFVYRIADVETDGKIYENFAAITVNGEGAGSTVVTHIPAGLEVQVTEEYTGGRYQLASENSQKATIVSDVAVNRSEDDEVTMASVAFTNEPNGNHPGGGHGIENHYSFTPDGTGIGVGGDFGSPTPSPEKPFQGDNVTPQE